MECSVALLLVVDVVTLILTSIWPLEYAWAFHFVVAPHSLIFTAVGPIVDACKKIKELEYSPPCLIIELVRQIKVRSK